MPTFEKAFDVVNEKVINGWVIIHKYDNSKAWGNIHYKEEGWVDVKDAVVFTSGSIKSPESIAHHSHPNHRELFNYGKLIEAEVVSILKLKGL